MKKYRKPMIDREVSDVYYRRIDSSEMKVHIKYLDNEFDEYNGDYVVIRYKDGTYWTIADEGNPKSTDVYGAVFSWNGYSYEIYGNVTVLEYYDPDEQETYSDAVFLDDVDYFYQNYENVHEVSKSESEPLEDIEQMIKSKRR